MARFRWAVPARGAEVTGGSLARAGATLYRTQGGLPGSAPLL